MDLITKEDIKLSGYRFRGLILVLLLILPYIFNQIGLSEGIDAQCYDIYGISYGNSYYRADKIFLGGSSSQSVPWEWIFWVILGDGRTILVDTGFDDYRMAEKWRISNYVNPVERLRQLGISALEVSDVILTHAHWDHIGNLTPYKNARIWIQEKEYQYANSIVNPNNTKAKGMRWQDVKKLKEIDKQGRLYLISTEETLMRGITVVMDGSHTPGHQYVIVKTIYGPVIIAGDASYMYENNLRLIAIGSAVNHDANLVAIKRMQQQVASPFLILPGHDPLVMKLFPKISDGIVHITSGIPLQQLLKEREGLLDINTR